MYWQSFVFTIQIILPVCLLVVLGYYLRHRNIVDEHFIQVGSRLVFTLTLPVLMFMAISKVRFESSSHFGLMLFVAIIILLSCLISVIWARASGVKREDQSAFVQAAFRSNLGIIGISMVVYAFGDEGTRIGALVLAVGVPMYNLLSVMVLAHGQSVNWSKQLLLIAKNPLIISIALALPFSIWQIHIPGSVESALKSIGNMTLPLALIGVGGTLDLSALRAANKTTIQISLLKLIVLPALSVVVALLVGIRGVELGVVALMLGSPTAAAAFVMASSMGANRVLTANAVAVTTLGSLVTMGGIFYVLRVTALV
ncbi:AEC family transporter [Parathalassolituus penaei]|uniref:AEC family transporter n=1 Tax=Parathalassolituus penaei TaxID=2997323 RepID=A0A9X3EDA0_9GAMM|nr:AEC family transporter [Parathalassolituus penaei]MCY0965457.1 AEC family transporter [Parathalassolituus penaei]